MDYVSTRGQADVLTFEDVMLRGLASDGGLYLPAHWPQFAPEQIAGMRGQPYAEIAFQVMRP
ncbi:MAG: threonine synthase, partial [Pseudomonadota bacterium]